jgi:glycosyltransferase involved in cell wall biosynthesis
MRICLISVEIFAWGKYGGFGRATRILGRELAKRGVEVYAVVPQRKGQKAVEMLDGIKILGFPLYNPFSAIKLFKQINADIYHSQEPSFGTYLAHWVMPDKKHVVTFRDPRDHEDWKIELEHHSLSKLQVLSNFLYEYNFLVKKAVRKITNRFCAAKCLKEKAQRIYGLDQEPLFLPTPVTIPPPSEKALNPTVCFIARWDRRKRPELFFELAMKFPHVTFIAVGKSRDKNYDDYLRGKYGKLPNLKLIGFVDQFNSQELFEILGKSWILINTASREGLPNSYIEAAAHRCAILSHVDPDDFASQFGVKVLGTDFAGGLEKLLKNNLWRELGERGHRYVKDTFELSNATEQHLRVYNTLLQK